MDDRAACGTTARGHGGPRSTLIWLATAATLDAATMCSRQGAGVLLSRQACGQWLNSIVGFRPVCDTRVRSGPRSTLAWLAAAAALDAATVCRSGRRCRDIAAISTTAGTCCVRSCLISNWPAPFKQPANIRRKLERAGRSGRTHRYSCVYSNSNWPSTHRNALATTSSEEPTSTSTAPQRVKRPRAAGTSTATCAKNTREAKVRWSGDAD